MSSKHLRIVAVGLAVLLLLWGGSELFSRGSDTVTGSLALPRLSAADVDSIVLVQNAIDWLSQDDALIAIRSKDRSPPPLVFSSSVTRGAAKYGNLIGVPLLLIAAGIARLLRRRGTTRRVYRPLAATA